MPEPTTCTHPSAQRDVYRNNGRLFSYCRACDTDLSWTDDDGRGGPTMPDLVASQEVAGESAGSGVTALDAGHRITGPSPATRPDSECGSPASRTAALLAGSDELPAGCQTQSGPDNRAPSDDGNAVAIGREVQP